MSGINDFFNMSERVSPPLAIKSKRKKEPIPSTSKRNVKQQRDSPECRLAKQPKLEADEERKRLKMKTAVANEPVFDDSNEFLDESEYEKHSINLKTEDDAYEAFDSASLSSKHDAKEETPLTTQKKQINESYVSINDAIKENIMSGAYNIIKKSGRSKVWEVFGAIQEANGSEINGKVACKMCNSVLKYDTRCVSNLLRHKCYSIHKVSNVEKIDVNDNCKQEVLTLLSQWSIENCRPFHIGQDSGLKRFAEYLIQLGARYGAYVDADKLLPSPAAIAHTIANHYELTVEDVQREIMAQCEYGYGLTTDIWTDSYLRRSYISLTIHYVINDKMVSNFLGLIQVDAEQSTNESIKTKIDCLLKSYNLLPEDAILVTNMESHALAALKESTHIFCINHLLNNAVERSVAMVDEISELCILCSKIVKYFEKSVETSNLFSSLTSLPSTRWNRVYYLLDVIEKNWSEIGLIMEEKNKLKRIENIDIGYVRAVVGVLKQFENASTKMESQEYATLHLVHAYLNILQNACLSKNDNDNDVIKRFKKTLYEQIQSSVLPNLKITHKMALFLFPPANKLIHFSAEDRILLKSECKNQLTLFAKNVTNESSDNSPTLPKTTSVLSDYFNNFATPSNKNLTEKIEDEIIAYERLIIPYEENFNVVEWWYMHKTQFPLLHQLSCKIFAIPATSAASERVFSLARHILSAKSTPVEFDVITLNRILFTHLNQ